MTVKLHRDVMRGADFPWLSVLVFAPCALLAGLGVWVPVTASVMTLDMVWNSASLAWSQLCARLPAAPCSTLCRKLASGRRGGGPSFPTDRCRKPCTP